MTAFVISVGSSLLSITVDVTLWIPDLQMCMLNFLIKAEFVNTTKCYKGK